MVSPDGEDATDESSALTASPVNTMPSRQIVTETVPQQRSEGAVRVQRARSCTTKRFLNNGRGWCSGHPELFQRPREFVAVAQQPDGARETAAPPMNESSNVVEGYALYRRYNMKFGKKDLQTDVPCGNTQCGSVAISESTSEDTNDGRP